MNQLRSIIIFFLFIIAVPGFSQEQRDTSRTIQSWKLNDNFTGIDTVKMDTLLPFYQIYNPAFENHFASTYLGNLGSATESNIPSERYNQTGFILFQPVQDYMEIAQNVKYYHTKKPFTKLTYISGGPKATAEQILTAIHTQNVNPFFNFALHYSLFSSGGQYPNQKTKNSAFAFAVNYAKGRYETHGNICVNKFDIRENGGILNDTVATPKDYTWIPVHLEYAGNRYLHMGAFLTQSLGFGRFPWQKKDSTLKESDTYLSSFHYTIRYDRYFRKFYDEDLLSQSGSGDLFPDSSYFHGLGKNLTSMSDSVFFRKFSQLFQIQLHESPGSWLRFKGEAGIFHEVFSYLNYQQLEKWNLNPENTASVILPKLQNSISNRTSIQSNPFTKYLYNIGIQAFIQNEAGKHFAWNAQGSLTISGYNAGDYNLQVSLLGTFSGQWAAIQAGRNSQRPDFYLQQYRSGNYSWDFVANGIVLKPIGTSFARIVTHGNIINFSGEIRLYDHYMYITETKPAQADNAFLTMSVVAGRTFKLGKLYSSFNSAFQYSGSELLNLPAITVKNSTWFEQSLVKDVLMSNLGFDIYYYTSYYADGYNPAIGLFYTQNDFKSGNYPYIDVFLNLKPKRTRIILKYDHVNSGLLPRTYFTAAHYPMQARVLKFGVSWTFYD
jgi:hypothetical protein